MLDHSNDEIDVRILIKRLYKSRKLIISISILFFFFGIALGFILPKKYSSQTVFIPQNQESSNGSSLSGVASLVGINLNQMSFGGEIPSSMYPEISQSIKFKRSILEKYIDLNNSVTLKMYLINYYGIKQEEKINESQFHVSLSEEKCFKILDKIISIDVNQKDGFVTIKTEMPVAEYSAILAKLSKDILQTIIIENKIESAKQNLEFSENQLAEKKIEFEKIQNRLSYFKDSNLNIVNSSVINEQDKLEAEFNIINAVVEELAKQVEQAKLQVKKDTPVFSTIKEAAIPNSKTSPENFKLIIIFTFIGLLISSVFVLVKDYFSRIYFEIK